MVPNWRTTIFSTARRNQKNVDDRESYWWLYNGIDQVTEVKIEKLRIHRRLREVLLWIIVVVRVINPPIVGVPDLL